MSSRTSMINKPLPERLNHAASRACDPECEGRCAVCPAEAMYEASTEIERLRARVAELTGLLIELDAHEGAEGWSKDLNVRLVAALSGAQP